MNKVYLTIPRVDMIYVMLLPGKIIKIVLIFYDRLFAISITS